MTTCPACSRPVAEGQTYHIQCDPYARIERLEKAILDYLSEFDNPVPDYAYRAQLRERLRKLARAPRRQSRVIDGASE